MLREAITSTISQTTAPEYVVVCSDGYDAATRAVCDEFSLAKTPVTLIEGVHVGRPSVVRNRAMRCDELRRSRYVAFCDDDDRWLPTKLARQREAMEQGGWAVLGTATTLVDPRGEVMGSQDILQGGSRHVRLRDLASGNTIALSSVMMLTSLWRDLGGFCPAAPTWEDYDLWIRAAVRGARIATLGEPLILYRVHDGLTRRETEVLRRQALAHVHRHIPVAAIRPWSVMAMRRLRGAVRLRSRLRHGARALREKLRG